MFGGIVFTPNVSVLNVIFGLEYSYKKVEINESFPKYIIENKEKLKEWII